MVPPAKVCRRLVLFRVPKLFRTPPESLEKPPVLVSVAPSAFVNTPPSMFSTKPELVKKAPW